VEIIDRIVSKGVKVSSADAFMAIRQGHVDIVEWFFSSGRVSPKFGVEECVEAAKKTGDEEIIAIVQTWAQKRVEREARSGNEKSTKKRLNFWKSQG
jgi:hypothetical protein